MNVRELIKELKKYPPEMNVYAVKRKNNKGNWVWGNVSLKCYPPEEIISSSENMDELEPDDNEIGSIKWLSQIFAKKNKPQTGENNGK